jgi:polyisoprenoid-binding protein YceI
MTKRRVLRGGGVLLAVVVVAGAAGFWWFFIRDDAPEEARLVDRAVAEEQASELEGSWTVAPGPEVFAGYRIDEVVGSLHNTAVARTGEVQGDLTVEGTEITEVSVSADMSTLVSQDDQVPGVGNRDAAMKTAALETDTFPTASFTLTEPIDLGALPEAGEEITMQATGELELHGQTQSVQVPVSARWNGEVVDLTASVDVVLADFGIEQPAPQIVTIEDHGIVELQLTFSPAA